ncbi:hypothetical protein DFAR_3070004 [Desulfarculales bacterium]
MAERLHEKHYVGLAANIDGGWVFKRQ